jgi:hypothetical protein
MAGGRGECVSGAVVRYAAVLVGAAGLTLCVSCGRAPGAAAGGAGSESPGPKATLERIMSLRKSGAYAKMEELIVPQRRHEVSRTLVAVDDFLHANAEICRYVREHVALGAAQAMDQSGLAASLDIFSPFVELLHERVEGDRATVAFQVDRRLPLKRAELRRVDGRWLYDPGPGYRPEIPLAFSRMARGLRQVLADLRSGRLPVEELRANPDRLLEEVRLRLAPGARMLPKRSGS